MMYPENAPSSNTRMVRRPTYKMENHTQQLQGEGREDLKARRGLGVKAKEPQELQEEGRGKKRGLGEKAKEPHTRARGKG